ncbi:MAG TPA: ABC transporter ATP-binding protein, partial [Acidimicrobiales bacterium]|nr:ABC transporter ATP-binding protein [Acidimicrobiales bacterium]
ITMDGTAVDGTPSRDLGRRRSFVSQDQPADLELTVLEVALIGRTPHKGRIEPDRAVDRDIARASLEQVEMHPLRHRTVPTLSGGERQRTFIARALAQQAPVLLLDEPTNHLDLRHQHKLLADLRSAAATVVASLHDPQLALAYADQAVVLDHGRVVGAGTPAEVLTEPVLRDVWGVRATVDRTGSGPGRITISGVA